MFNLKSLVLDRITDRPLAATDSVEGPRVNNPRGSLLNSSLGAIAQSLEWMVDLTYPGLKR